jgi:ornithine--oxo-acid transaminase
MNTGAEAVETAIKAARKWGYLEKGVPEDRAEIICCENNFHGRTTTIVGFSSEAQYRYGFGPFSPGFRLIPYGDVQALEEAINENTVGFLVEPIQGEGGVVIPPEGYLGRCAEICREHRVLLLNDEIQTGLGRAGRMFCGDWDGERGDVLIVGKALGGGVYPVSAALASREVMSVFTPGDHGSTFGGNPLGAAVGRASLNVIIEEDLPGCADRLGRWFMDRLREFDSPHIAEVRGRGLMIGVVVREESGPARPFAEALMERGILAKETHEQVIRFAPPLVISQEELEWALPAIEEVVQGAGVELAGV